jgi:transposase
VKKETHRAYDLEFKRQAVLLANHPDLQVQQVAAALGIHPFMLSRWKKEIREQRLMGDKPMTPPAKELAEANKRIRQLERQLKRTQEEVEILKKFERFVAAKNKTSTDS